MKKFKKYDKYKNTDIAWLNKIPSHWTEIPNRCFLTELKNKVGKNSSKYTLLSLTKNGVIIRDLSEMKGKFPAEFDSYKIVNKGNLILCLFDIEETPRTVGLSKFKGMITGAYNVLKIENVNPQFITYFYIALDNTKELRSLYRGLRKTIKIGKFLSIKTPIPPIDEQDKIVSFIEYKEKQINKLIKKQKKLIELLEEKKKIIITEAVTKGLDKSVPMKDSGIDYIGQIPQNWEIKKIKQILKQISKKKIYRGGIYIGMENIESWTGRFNVILNANIEGVSNIFSKGQILFGKLRPYLAKCIITDCAGLCSSELLVLKPNKDHDENFIQKLMLSKTFIDLVDASTYGAKMPRANWNFIKNIECAIPDINEQREIIKYINKIDEFINKLIQNKKILIEKLEDYKKNLISFAVTGQIDVRDYEIPKTDDDVDLEEIENFSEDDTETISEVEYANN